MNPSIQCIFERTLAGIAVVIILLALTFAVVWGIIHTPLPDKPVKIHPALVKTWMWLMGLCFTSVTLMGCYYAGKDILEKFGVCHLK